MNWRLVGCSRRSPPRRRRVSNQRYTPFHHPRHGSSNCSLFSHTTGMTCSFQSKPDPPPRRSGLTLKFWRCCCGPSSLGAALVVDRKGRDAGSSPAQDERWPAYSKVNPFVVRPSDQLLGAAVGSGRDSPVPRVQRFGRRCEARGTDPAVARPMRPNLVAGPMSLPEPQCVSPTGCELTNTAARTQGSVPRTLHEWFVPR